MSMDQEDISEAWKDLIPTTRSPRTNTSKVVEDFSEEWHHLQGLPRTFYHVVKGRSLDQMAILKFRCTRITRKSEVVVLSGFRESILWSGSYYTRRTEGLDKPWNLYLSDVCFTLEDIQRKFETLRAEYLAELENEILSLTKAIEEKQADLAYAIEDLEGYRDLSLPQLDIPTSNSECVQDWLDQLQQESPND